MMTTVDYMIVGSGLTGGTIARLLADQGREVMVLERKNHLGGNVHDSIHPSGIRYHTYGPHYFRCSSKRIWEFVRRFSEFYPHNAHVKCRINGQYYPWPLHESMFDLYPGWQPPSPATPAKNFEESCLRKMPRPLYEAFIEGYTRRQWGVEPWVLDSELGRRVRINSGRETSLTPRCLFQGLPTSGYAQFTANLVAGIPYALNTDYLGHRSEYRARRALVFTGSLDEFFHFDAGRLGYRSQKRRHHYLPDCRWHQPCVQVNHPDASDNGPIRTLEWKHLMSLESRQAVNGTLITEEYPFTPYLPEEFEYPFPSEGNAKLYQHYRTRAAAIPRLVVCGRLGSYRYFDMDQAIGHAMTVAAMLLKATST
jgi:UDP-galactopyranose mutase